MKMFGEFLVEQKILNEQTLADSLVEQIKCIPTVLDVIHQKALLPAAILLSALKYQSQNPMEFQAACVHLGVWNSDLEERIRTEINKFRKPLGHILIKNGNVSFDILVHALDDYQHYQKTYAVSQEPISPQPNTGATAIAEPKKGDHVSGDFMPTFVTLDVSMLTDYLDLVDEEKHATLERLILSWENLKQDKKNAPEMKKNIQETYRLYHSIKGGARFIKAEISEKIIHHAEDTLSVCTRFINQVTSSDFETLTSLNLKCIDIVWTLRNTIKTEGSEQSFWKSVPGKRNFQSLMIALAEFKNRINAENSEVTLEQLTEDF